MSSLMEARIRSSAAAMSSLVKPEFVPPRRQGLLLWKPGFVPPRRRCLLLWKPGSVLLRRRCPPSGGPDSFLCGGKVFSCGSPDPFLCVGDVLPSGDVDSFFCVGDVLPSGDVDPFFGVGEVRLGRDVGGEDQAGVLFGQDLGHLFGKARARQPFDETMRIELCQPGVHDSTIGEMNLGATSIAAFGMNSYATRAGVRRAIS